MHAHHFETVPETLAVTLLRDAAHEVVGRDEAGIDSFAALFQDFDTPVVVGAEVVFDERRRDGKAGNKGLMHDKHSTEKLSPMQVFRQFPRAEFAHCADGAAFRVHEHGFAIEHIGFGGDERGHFFQHIRRMDVVAAVETPHEVALSDAKSLVHSIVQPFVRLRNPANPGHRRGEFLYDFQRIIFGSAVHEDVFDEFVRISLPAYAFHRAGQVGLAVIYYGNDGENDGRGTMDGGRCLFCNGLFVQDILNDFKCTANVQQMYGGMVFRQRHLSYGLKP